MAAGSGHAVVTGGQGMATGGSGAVGVAGSGGDQAVGGGGLASGGAATGGAEPASGGSVASGGATGTGGSTDALPAGGVGTGGFATGGEGGAAATGGNTDGPGTGGAGTGGDGMGTGGQATGGAGTGGSAPSGPLSVYIAGDSTVSTYADTGSTTDQAGWGQMLGEYFNDQVTVVNRAAGGRTALWFALEGAVDEILSTIEPGDYFLIQFGTNDSHETATFTVEGQTYQRWADPDTDFKAHLKTYYLDPTRQLGAIPVLVTPPPRNSAYCTGGNSLSRWAQAMRELGAAEDVTVSDLNQKTVDYLTAICPSPTPEDFFFLRADGTVDGTHFQENGARIMAGFVADGVEEAGLGLAGYRL